MILTIWIVLGGVKNGIEKASKWMIPILFMFFIVLAVRSITLDGAFEGIKFMFVPDWSYHTGKTFLLAMGQAFFKCPLLSCKLFFNKFLLILYFLLDSWFFCYSILVPIASSCLYKKSTKTSLK